MSLIPPDALAALKDDIADILEEQAKELLQGAAGDLKKYVIAITADMAKALLLPEERRQAVLSELGAQLRAVGEINRIRAEQAAWETFQRVVATAGQVALSTALRAVPGA